ncbi:hypothetical protein RFI_06240 [Reticulomyxa filosa]|uniref:Uncharacterized protein n=1 Tax=Reticulomyxa filosa TaxID=46433 RepID=X6NYI0_RETFI|nr:hypothetical protein RFI_06240 [Reticulomyxa filosa]|eukprot:ETO30879.1 hypothetical protein RFI_06240 [Reticulomyxa filosa]
MNAKSQMTATENPAENNERQKKMLDQFEYLLKKEETYKNALQDKLALHDEINKKEIRLQTLQVEHQTLKHAHEKLVISERDLQKRYLLATKELATCKAQINAEKTKQSEFASFQTKMLEFMDENKRKSELESVKKQLNDQAKELQLSQNLVTQLTDERDQTQALLNGLNTTVTSLLEPLDTGIGIEEKGSMLLAKWKDQRDMLTKLQQQNETLSQQVDSLQLRIIELEAELEKWKNDWTTEVEKFKQLQERVEKMQSELWTTKNAKLEADEKLIKVETELSKVREKEKAIEEEYEKIKTKYEAAVGEHQNLSETITFLTKELATHKSEASAQLTMSLGENEITSKQDDLPDINKLRELCEKLGKLLANKRSQLVEETNNHNQTKSLLQMYVFILFIVILVCCCCLHGDESQYIHT